MKEYGKLIRDKIPEIIEGNGEKPITRLIQENAEYIEVLGDKLIEEAHEVKATPTLEELADALEVVYSLGEALGHTPAQIDEARLQKARERGRFAHRIFLIRTE